MIPNAVGSVPVKENFSCLRIGPNVDIGPLAGRAQERLGCAIAIAFVDGALEITAMDRTSLSDTEQRTRFNETLLLTEMHPAAVHLAGDALPSAHELVAQGANHSLFRLGFSLNSA